MIQIVGPKDKHKAKFAVINTTSSSKTWSRGLSPFLLGPVHLWGDYKARNVENAWQYSKVYPEHVGALGLPDENWLKWAVEGWNSHTAVRYPMGKDAKPLYSYFHGKKLNYLEARRDIYLPLYLQALKNSEVLSRLEREHFANDGCITLFDYDAYDYQDLGMTLQDVLNDPTKKMGHAFVLAMLLENKL